MLVLLTLFALCVCGCAFVHRRRWHRELVRLEAELHAIREKRNPRSVEDRVPLQQELSI